MFIPGWEGKFSSLFDVERFYRAIKCGAELQWNQSFQINAISEDFDGCMTCSEPIEQEEIHETLANGLTVCVHDIAAGDSSLRAFAEEIRSEMQFAGRISFNCYLSPDGSGADTHFDKSITTAIQISGKKVWRYLPHPSVQWPPANARLEADGVRQWTLPGLGYNGWDELADLSNTKFIEQLLEPGDILCLPAGTWHSAKAVGSSLALNMTFSPTPTSKFFELAIDDLLRYHPAWRAGIPPVLRSSATTDVPAEVKEYLAARVAELRDVLSRTDVVDDALVSLWQRMSETTEGK